MSSVLAIIVSYNAMPWLDRCLGSLAASSLVPDVLIIDNDSTDGTVDALQAFAQAHPSINISIEESGTNLGFAAANNIGLERALVQDYDYVYLLNQDAWVDSAAIKALVDVARGTVGYGVFSPLQMNAAMDCLDRNFAKYNRFVPSHIQVSPSRFFPAAHWLIPAAALRKVGAFSPSFRHYGEDDNWIDRLRYHGLKAGVVPAAKAVHDRQGRVRTKKERCTLKCNIPVIKLSNPSFRALLWVLWAPLWLVGCSFKNLSLIPIRSIPGLLRNYSAILQNRKLSKATGAFLTKS